MATYRTSAAGGTATANTNVTATLTPVLADLFVVFALETGTANTASSVTDNNANNGETGWTKFASVSYSGGVLSGWIKNHLLHNTTSTIVTYDPADTANTGAEIVLVAISGANAGGAAKGYAQFATNSGAAGVAATTFSTAANTSNMTLTALGNGTNPPGLTAPTSMINRQNVGQTTPLGEIVATRDSGFTGTVIQWGTNPLTDWGMISVELSASQHSSAYQNISGMYSLVGRSRPLLKLGRHQSLFPRAKRESTMVVIETKVSTAVTVPVTLRGVGSDTGIAGISSGAITVSLRKNGGGYSTITPTITDRGGGVYDLDLTTTHTNTLGLAKLRVAVTGYTGLEDVITNDDIMLNIIAIDKQNSSDMGISSIRLITGTVVADGTNSALTFKTNLTESSDDHFKRTIVVFTSGTLAEQIAKVDGYDGTTKFLDFGSQGFTASPSPGDTFYIINR